MLSMSLLKKCFCIVSTCLKKGLLLGRSPLIMSQNQIKFLYVQAAYVVHIFPSCDFANESLARIAPDLLHRVANIAHLLIVIATVQMLCATFWFALPCLVGCPSSISPSVQLRRRQLFVNRAVGAVNLSETHKDSQNYVCLELFTGLSVVCFNISCTRKVQYSSISLVILKSVLGSLP